MLKRFLSGSLRTLGLSAVAVCCNAFSAQAVPVQLVYTGTVQSFNGSVLPGAAIGSSIVFLVNLDNGGADLFNQVYDGTSFLSADILIGSYSASVSALVTPVFFTVSTDAAGSLTTLDIASTVTGTGSGGLFPTFLALNGNNVVFGAEDGGSFLSGVNAVVPPMLNNTSIQTLPPIPLPATAFLLAGALAGLIAARRWNTPEE